MKTFLILSANLCFVAGFSQTKNSARKDFAVTENIEILNARMKEDSLNGIKSVNTKKFPVNNNENENQSQVAIDTLSTSKTNRAAASKKK